MVIKMSLIRNPEVKRTLLCQLAFAISAILGASFFNILYAVYVLIVCLCYISIFWIFTKRRYDRISQLIYQMDKILHGDYYLGFIPDEEGELAVLTSELYKMTLRLREQAEVLKKDKVYLRDSIADISHQLKTPLTSIRMIIPRLKREETSIEERQEYVREVLLLLSKTEWLITALLKIARLESGTAAFKKDSISVKGLLEKSLLPLEILKDLKQISIDIDVEGSPVYMGDPLWSEEAIGNIIKNCVEHTPEKGRIWITAKQNSIYTEIIIADNGRGIAQEDLPRLFDRFYKGKGTDKDSAGIGLALSHMIINRQNGTLKAGSRLGGGAEFHIRFYTGAI